MTEESPVCNRCRSYPEFSRGLCIRCRSVEDVKARARRAVAERIRYVPKSLSDGEEDGVQVITTPRYAVPANQVFTEEELDARILALQQFYMTVKPELFAGKENWKL